MRSEFSFKSNHMRIREREASTKEESDSEKVMHQNMEETSL